jgi:ABC-2 type transport system permease protein
MNAAWNAFVLTWRHILADKAAITLFFVSGIIYSFFYPLPYSKESVQRVPVAVIDQDNSALSRQLIRYAAAHPGIDVVAVTSRPEDAQEMLWRGAISGTVLIPSDFSGKLLSGQQPEIDIAGNGTYLMLNKVALNAMAEVVGTVSAGVELKRLNAASPSRQQVDEQRQPLTTESFPLFNAREGYASYIVPGVVVLVMQQTFLLGIGMLFGTWSSAKSFPYQRGMASYVGALNAFALVIVLNAMYFFGFVFWWQDYPRGGNFVGSMVLTILFSYCVAALGILVGLFFRTRERSVQLLVATSMPIIFLSGLSWPIEALPALVQQLRWLVPSTAAIQGFIATNQLGASLQEVRSEMLALLVLALLFIVVGLRKWQK